jgi:hypothetical protein
VSVFPAEGAIAQPHFTAVLTFENATQQYVLHSYSRLHETTPEASSNVHLLSTSLAVLLMERRPFTVQDSVSTVLAFGICTLPVRLRHRLLFLVRPL